MAIYLIRKRDELPKGETDPWDPQYDTCFAMVIVAKSEEEARELASGGCFDEGSGCWKEPSFSICEEINPNSDSAVILQDVAWG